MKISHSDFMAVAEYIGKKCKGSKVSVEKGPNDKSISFVTSNGFDERVEITVYEEEVAAFPKITKTERLTKDS